MAGEYKQPGDRLRYKNTTDATIPAKTMVGFGAKVGVTLNDIQPGMEGPVQITGVWTYPCNFAAAVPRGAALYFDATSNVLADADTSGAVPAGIAAMDAAAGAGIAEIRLN